MLHTIAESSGLLLNCQTEHTNLSSSELCHNNLRKEWTQVIAENTMSLTCPPLCGLQFTAVALNTGASNVLAIHPNTIITAVSATCAHRQKAYPSPLYVQRPATCFQNINRQSKRKSVRSSLIHTIMTRLVVTHRAIPPRFLSMPLETREKIYSYVLNTSTSSEWTSDNILDTMTPEVFASTRRNISILLTSHQTYTEALPILYQHLSFLWLRSISSFGHRINFAATIGEPGAALIRYVSISTESVSSLPGTVTMLAEVQLDLEHLLSLLPGLDTVKLQTRLWEARDDPHHVKTNACIADCLKLCTRNHPTITTIIHRWPMSRTYAFFVLHSAKSNFKLYRIDRKIDTA